MLVATLVVWPPPGNFLKGESMQSRITNSIPDTAIRMPDRLEAETELTKSLESYIHLEVELLNLTLLAHWNASGINFHDFHKLTEEQYKASLDNIDDVAERKRALGSRVHSLLASKKDSRFQSHNTKLMARDLSAYHIQLSVAAKKIHKLAEAEQDIATADLLAKLVSYHEKQAWILGCSAA